MTGSRAAGLVVSAWLMGVVATACAPALREPQVTPADIPALEARAARTPGNAGVLAALGVAYYKGGDFRRAATTLAAARQAAPEDPVTALYLGLSLEEVGATDSAKAVYRDVLAARTLPRGARAPLADRLQLVERQLLHEEARRAVAQESTLSRLEPEPNTVAVLPWRYTGSDSSLAPLGRGLTHLMITDLGRVRRLRLLERERVQALVDEASLVGAGRADPATAARSGRLLRAGTVVEGAVGELPFDATRIRLDATALTTESGVVAATGSADDRLAQLFDLEKAVVFQLLDQLGISLSPAERRAIDERPTRDLQAFLAFSRGLERDDRGDFAGAAREYGEAARLDPGFGIAAARSEESTRLATAQDAAPAGQAAEVRRHVRRSAERGTTLRRAADRALPTIGAALDRRGRIGVGGDRAGLPEVFRQDDPRDTGTIGEIVIIIPRP